METEEIKLVETAEENYRKSNHNVYDFIHDFFGVTSSKPSVFLYNIKTGRTTISIESWARLNAYVSKIRSK